MSIYDLVGRGVFLFRGGGGLGENAISIRQRFPKVLPGHRNLDPSLDLWLECAAWFQRIWSSAKLI